MQLRQSLLALISAPVLALSGTPSGGVPAPFNEQGLSTLVSSAPETYADEGHVSGLGPFTGTATVYVTGPGMILVVHEWNFAAGSLTLEATSTAADPVGLGTFTITGGTGAFAAATGSGDTFAEAVGPGEVRTKYKGQITY